MTRDTSVVYCYTVRNQTAVTQTVHTLTDSHWGTLFDKAPLTLGPDSPYIHAISRTVTAEITPVATWIAEARSSIVVARSALSRRTNR